ncbi:hypothetical protein OF83DRAFT_631084 [Amylostereum chailletii]|nr:hypothetical protein OF83DRAFT_631084 [Amylostereum chailletii]
MSISSLSSLSSGSELGTLTISIPKLKPVLTPLRRSSEKDKSTRPSPTPTPRRTSSRRDDVLVPYGRRDVERRSRSRSRPRHRSSSRRRSEKDDRALVSRRDVRPRSERSRRSDERSRTQPTLTSETSVTRSLTSTFTTTSYDSRYDSRRRRADTRTFSDTYTDLTESTETGYDIDDPPKPADPGPYDIHGRTDVLPAMQLEPYSAFLAAYRLSHLAGIPTSPASPDALVPAKGDSSSLPTHLLPVLSAVERRARRLALLLDSDDLDVRDWALEEYVKLGRSGRRLVREGVFEVKVKDDGLGVNEDKSDAGWDDDDEEKVDGEELESLRERFGEERERREEREELEREHMWAREMFAGWWADGRIDGVFRDAAGVLNDLLKEMAREEGEEWAGGGTAADREDKEEEEEDIRPDESASVRDYGDRECEVEASVTEKTGSKTQVKPPSIVVRTPVPSTAPLPLPSPEIKQTTPKKAADTTPKKKASSRRSSFSELPQPSSPNIQRDFATAKPEGQYDSYADFYSRDPRRPAEEDRPIRPLSQAYQAQFNSHPTPEKLFNTYAEFYAQDRRKKSDIASNVSRRSAPKPSPMATLDVPPSKERYLGPSREKETSTEETKVYKSDKPADESPKAASKSRKSSPPPRKRSRTPSRRASSPHRSRRGSSPHRSRRASPQRSRRESSPHRSRRESSPYRSRREPSPHCSRREPSPHNARREPSPHRSRREPSPKRSSRAPSPKRSSRAPSPRRSTRAPSPRRSTRASSPRRSTREHSPRRSKRDSSPRRRSRSRPRHKALSTVSDALEDVAVSSSISKSSGGLTTPNPSPPPSRTPSPTLGLPKKKKARRAGSGLTTPTASPPRSMVKPREPTPPPPPPPPRERTPPPPPSPITGPGKGKKNKKNKGGAMRLRGGAGSPEPPDDRMKGRRKFGIGDQTTPAPPPSQLTETSATPTPSRVPLIPRSMLVREGAEDADANAAVEEDEDEGDAAGEAGFPPLPPLPPIQFWLPGYSAHEQNRLKEEGEKPKLPPVFLALGARRACIPYTPAFQGLDLRVVV